MKTLIIILSAFLGTSFAQHEHHHHDEPSTHGMLVVGSKKVYLSHLPMFVMPEHAYQVIFEAEFPADVKAIYNKAQATSSEKIYTLVPETFVLPDMALNPRPFKARLFQGHFERGGKRITGTFTVNVKTLFFRPFEESDKRPEAYVGLLFGNAEEQFLAHFISVRPDFDQVMQVQAPIADETKAVEVTGENTKSDVPLKSGEKLNDIKVLKEFYLEFGDLS